MRNTKLCSGFVLLLLAGLTACGGSSSPPTAKASTPTPSPTAAPTATPSPTPSPGPLQVAYTSNFGVSSTATAAPSPVAFLAAAQTVSVTTSQTGNGTAGYKAAANAACGSGVTVSPASSTTGSFTITAAGTVASSAGCDVAFSGATGTSSVSLGASVPAPGGVSLLWIGPGQGIGGVDVVPVAGPVNMIGLGSLFDVTLMVSETHYLGTFTVPASACAGDVTLTKVTSVPSPFPSALPGQSVVYYTANATAAVAQTPACDATVTDSASNSSSIQFVVTAGGGTIQ